MKSAPSAKTGKEENTIAVDSFFEKIKQMIDNGKIASMPGNKAKTEIVSTVQDYSGEIPFLPGEISKLFLNLCDLMLDGRIGRMPPDAFKVYLVISIYSYGIEPEQLALDNTLLQKLTGISEESVLREAMETLENEGYIESSDDPSGRRTRLKLRGHGNGTEKHLFLI